MEIFSFAIGFVTAAIIGIIFVAVKALVMARNNKRLIRDMKKTIDDRTRDTFQQIDAIYRYIDSRIDKMINKGKDKKQILND